MINKVFYTDLFSVHTVMTSIGSQTAPLKNWMEKNIKIYLFYPFVKEKSTNPCVKLTKSSVHAEACTSLFDMRFVTTR